MVWIVYILECADATLYTGITTDLEARLAKHASGQGAKYTRGRGPFRVMFTQPCASKSEALAREMAIKALNRKDKLALLVEAAV